MEAQGGPGRAAGQRPQWGRKGCKAGVGQGLQRAQRLWPGHAGWEVTLTFAPRLLRLLSRESPSGAMKAVLRKAGSGGSGEEKQFLEVGAGQPWPGPLIGPAGDQGVGSGAQPARQALLGRRQSDARCPQVWEKNRKLKSFNLSALEKHGPVYEDGEAPAATGRVGRGAATARGSP